MVWWCSLVLLPGNIHHYSNGLGHLIPTGWSTDGSGGVFRQILVILCELENLYLHILYIWLYMYNIYIHTIYIYTIDYMYVICLIGKSSTDHGFHSFVCLLVNSPWQKMIIKKGNLLQLCVCERSCAQIHPLNSRRTPHFLGAWWFSYWWFICSIYLFLFDPQIHVIQEVHPACRTHWDALAEVATGVTGDEDETP